MVEGEKAEVGSREEGGGEVCKIWPGSPQSLCSLHTILVCTM